MTTAAETVTVRSRSRWLDLVGFVLLFLVMMFTYEALRDLVAPADTAQRPFDHADQVISFERSLGLLIEPDVQRIVHDAPGGRFATTWFYTIAYTAGYALFFLWIWLRHRAHLLFFHTWYWVTNGVAVLVYWLYPLAPPRFIDGLGLEDSTKSALEVGGTLKWFEPFRNQFAAMPSMHVGQTVLYAIAIMMLVRSRARWGAWVWPAVMLITVMATANHFWLDGVGGAVCVLAALGITAALLPSRRPWRARAA